MIQFIEVNGLFINLGLIAHASIETDDDGNNILTLTTIHGTTLDYDGDDAEAIHQRLTLLAMQTASVTNQLIIQADLLAKQGATP